MVFKTEGDSWKEELDYQERDRGPEERVSFAYMKMPQRKSLLYMLNKN